MFDLKFPSFLKMVMLDQFISHLKNSVKENLIQGNTELAINVRALTSQFQSFDVSILKNLNLWLTAPKGATPVNQTSATDWQMAV